MPTKPGAYHRPETLDEAVELLRKADSVILSGGTKLLADETGLPVEHVVDLQALGLNQIRGENGALTIGAACRLTDLAATLAQEYPSEQQSALLQGVIQREGPNTYRNAATVGGTVASRPPDSELLAVLLLLDARLLLSGPTTAGEVDLASYLASGDKSLIAQIVVPWEDGQGAVERVARTPADYPIVSVAAWRPAGEPVRLAATGTGPRPLRLADAEAAVASGVNEKSVSEAANAAREASQHPGDFRGSADYRAEMAAVLTRRVLQALAAA